MAQRQSGQPPQVGPVFACVTTLGFAIYPILQFFSHNRGYTPPHALVRALVVSVVTASLVLLIGRTITDVRRTAVSLSVVLLMLALYQGGVQALLPRESPGAWLYLLASIVASILVWRAGPASRNAIGIIVGIIVLVLLTTAAVEIAAGESRQDRERWAKAVSIHEEGLASPSPSGSRPDIYYIVLDAFARSDVLGRMYGVDNTPFVEYLEASGFYVAKQARSNYAQTLLSVASSLNMSYLSGIADTMRGTNDRSPVLYLTRYNHVARILRDAGYSMVFIGSDYTPLATSPLADECFCETFGLSEFEAVMLSRTPFWVPAIDRALVRGHRQKVLYAFDRLAAVAVSDTPRFVMAHIMAPHPPFVFDRVGGTATQHHGFSFADGTYFPGSREEYISGYREQVQFITAQLSRVIEAVLARRTPRDVVMVVQGDHGPGSRTDWASAERTDLRERLSIFSAYRLPGGEEVLYPSMSPVNTFRTIFNRYLGRRLDALENESYFSTWDEPYDFIRVAP